MSKHAHQHEREVTTELSGRVRVLEVRVAVQAGALLLLTGGLAQPPTAESGGRPAAEAARPARDVLLAATHESQEAE